MELFIRLTSISDIENILIFPEREKGKLPLMVIPHGGPHSCSTTSYSSTFAFIASTMKYNILLVNYRGSTGFGEDNLNSLPGNIGEQDVSDTKDSIDYVMTKYGDRIDEKRIYAFGGSHAGIIIGQMVAEYKDYFKVIMGSLNKKSQRMSCRL